MTTHTCKHKRTYVYMCNIHDVRVCDINFNILDVNINYVRVCVIDLFGHYTKQTLNTEYNVQYM